MIQCKKQTTVAIIMKDGEFISMGMNTIENDPGACPRKDMETGEGYHLCKEVCGQMRHAEVDACMYGGDRVRGGTLYLIGHTYCCKYCTDVMHRFGIKEVVTMESGTKIDPETSITKEEEGERLYLIELQRDHSRWFSGEEFDRLRYLSSKAFRNAGNPEKEVIEKIPDYLSYLVPGQIVMTLNQCIDAINELNKK